MSEWGEPRRWNESDLPEDLRRVLESAETDHDPARAESLERRLAPLLGWPIAVTAAEGAGGGTAAGASAQTAAATGSAASAGSAGIASGVKVLVATVVTAGAVGGGVWIATDVGSPIPVPSRDIPAEVHDSRQAPRSPSAPATPSITSSHAVETDPPEATSVPAPVHVPSSIVRPARSSTPETTAVIAPSSPDPGQSAAALAEEVAGIEAIRAALQTSPERAVELADQHAARFGEGVLGPERDVLRVEALIATGRRAEARALTESMLERDPRSAHVRRLRRLLRQSARGPTGVHNPYGDPPMQE